MRYLTLPEILDLHERLVSVSGGSMGIRDLGALESAISQPRMTFKHNDLYPDIVTKAAALCFSLVRNHAFVDGNKRIGHAAMEAFLILNGYEIKANVDEQEKVIVELAKGTLDRDQLVSWLQNHLVQMTTE